MMIPIDRVEYERLRAEDVGVILAREKAQRKALLSAVAKAREKGSVEILADVLETIIQLKF